MIHPERRQQDIWQQVSDQYLSLYEQTLNRLLLHQIEKDRSRQTSASMPTTVNSSTSRDDAPLTPISQFVAPLSNVEYHGVNSTIDARCLSLISRQQLNQLGRQSPIRPSLQHFFQRVLPLCHRKEASLSITSANWSYTVLYNCLSQLQVSNGTPLQFKLVSRLDNTEFDAQIDVSKPWTNSRGTTETYEIPVYCNELEFNGKDVSTGQFQLLQIVSSEEKWQCVDRELQRLAQQERYLLESPGDIDSNTSTAAATDNGAVVIFVGDSLHDLYCLTKAHIGIVMTNSETQQVSSSLQKACDMLQIRLLDIASQEAHDLIRQQVDHTTLLQPPSQEESDTKTLFVAQSWSQITLALFSHH